MGIKLAIVTPTEDVLDVECDEVVAPGINGEVGLLPGHVALITALRPGVMTIVESGRKRFLAVSTGFAEVESDQVTILTDSCEEAGVIDPDRARRAKEDAESKLLAMGADDKGYVEQRRRLARAQARLDASARR